MVVNKFPVFLWNPKFITMHRIAWHWSYHLSHQYKATYFRYYFNIHTDDPHQSRSRRDL